MNLNIKSDNDPFCHKEKLAAILSTLTDTSSFDLRLKNVNGEPFKIEHLITTILYHIAENEIRLNGFDVIRYEKPRRTIYNVYDHMGHFVSFQSSNKNGKIHIDISTKTIFKEKDLFELFVQLCVGVFSINNSLDFKK